MQLQLENDLWIKRISSCTDTGFLTQRIIENLSERQKKIKDELSKREIEPPVPARQPVLPTLGFGLYLN